MHKIIDNFFDDPDAVRSTALSQKFEKIPGYYPGLRSWVVSPEINEKIYSIIKDTYGHNNRGTIHTFFQLIPSVYGRGWAHRDANSYGAGIVYLHPTPPEESGTIIYSKPKTGVSETALNQKYVKIKNARYNSKLSDNVVYRKQRDYFNSCFEEDFRVENVYNKLVTYSGETLHSENNPFGDSRDSARLTLVFFYYKQHLQIKEN